MGYIKLLHTQFISIQVCSGYDANLKKEKKEERIVLMMKIGISRFAISWIEKQKKEQQQNIKDSLLKQENCYETCNTKK